MLALHDHVTRQMCERLGITCIGLGLVRLLQDAKRFDEAGAVLHALENRIKSTKPRQKRRKISQKRSRLSKSVRIDAA